MCPSGPGGPAKGSSGHRGHVVPRTCSEGGTAGCAQTRGPCGRGAQGSGSGWHARLHGPGRSDTRGGTQGPRAGMHRVWWTVPALGGGETGCAACSRAGGEGPGPAPGLRGWAGGHKAHGPVPAQSWPQGTSDGPKARLVRGSSEQRAGGTAAQAGGRCTGQGTQVGQYLSLWGHRHHRVQALSMGLHCQPVGPPVPGSQMPLGGPGRSAGERERGLNARVRAWPGAAMGAGTVLGGRLGTHTAQARVPGTQDTMGPLHTRAGISKARWPSASLATLSLAAHHLQEACQGSRLSINFSLAQNHPVPPSSVCQP